MTIVNKNGDPMDKHDVRDDYNEAFKKSPEYICLTKGHIWEEPRLAGDVAFRCKRCRAEIEDKGGENETD